MSDPLRHAVSDPLIPPYNGYLKTPKTRVCDSNGGEAHISGSPKQGLPWGLPGEGLGVPGVGWYIK